MEALLYQYNPWWETSFSFAEIIERKKYLCQLLPEITSPAVIFLTGLRRVGKTSLMKLMIKHLLEEGTQPRRIFYLSLDDYLLNSFSIREILGQYRQLHRLGVDEKIWVFLDEITYKTDYQQQLKNLYDQGNTKVFASSSSSSLLKDRKALLTGRSRTIEVLPLTYDEFLLFKGIELKKRDAALYEAYFEDYIRQGGMPEQVLHPDRAYLMNLVDDILQKDIVAFHNIRHAQLIKDYFILLMERSGKQLSLGKIARILKISPDTAGRYLRYFEETYLVHLCQRWGKTNEQLLSPRKIYAADLGIKHLLTGFRDLGSYFENYVFMQIKQQQPAYVYENSTELDFMTADRTLIECKYHATLTPAQQQLFEEFPAREKVVIARVSDLQRLLARWPA